MFKVFATPFLPTISAMAVSVRQTLCGVATLRTAIHLLLTYLLTYLLCCQCETRDEGTFNKTSMIWTYFGFTADKYENPIDDGKPLFRECLKSMRCRFGNNTNLYKHLKDHHQLLQYRKTQV